MNVRREKVTHSNTVLIMCFGVRVRQHMVLFVSACIHVPGIDMTNMWLVKEGVRNVR
jgi:hypothetical protein